MIGMITPAIVVIRVDRRSRGKAVQPGNREQAIVIVCLNSEGQDIPLFLVVQGVCYLSSWYTEGGLLYNWPIKPTSNRQTNNKKGLDQLKHFNKHTKPFRQGRYRILVLDKHESYNSVVFQDYYKENNIITLCLPAYSSHITQLLDVRCFSILKRMYGR